MPENNWRILCIDDDPDILEILKATLGMEYEVVTASDGLEAMSLLDFCDADFVICDVMMPHMNGFQTIEALRSHPDYMDVPVFFLTAETSRDSAKKGFVSGANLYLTKPFDPMRVLENIEYFLKEMGSQPRPKRMPAEQVGEELKRLGSVATQSADGAVSDAKPRVIVLTADDSQTLTVREALQGGFECVCCADPLESLQQLFRYEPDLLMINPMIPRLSGMGLAQMIRSNPRLRKIPILLLEDKDKDLDPRLVASISRLPLIKPHSTPGAVRAAVENVTGDPAFQPRKKSASIEELQEQENKVRGRIAEEHQREARGESRRQKRFEKIQEYLDRIK